MDFPASNGHGPRHLLLSYVWSVNNIGDIAISPGFVSLLRKFAPDLPVRIFASQVEDMPAYAGVRDYFGANFQNCETLPNPFKPLMGDPRFDDNASAWGRFCQRWGREKLDAFVKGCLASDLAQSIADDLLSRFAGEIADELGRKQPAALDAFKRAGFVVYVSGTTFNFGRLQVRDFWTFALHFAMPLIVARHLGVPYGINAQSFDAIDWPADLVLRPVFKDAQFLFCRDSDSLAYLQHRDLGGRVGGFRPDSTFFFDVENEAWAERFLADNGLMDRKFLVLITRHSRPVLDQGSAWDKVGGDPTAGSVTPERQEKQMAKLRAFIEAWIQKTGMPILMGLEARSALEPMRQWLDRGLSDRAREGLVWLNEFWNTEQAYSVYRRARIVISMEMHSIIMAVQSRTPTVHIPFREAGRKARMLHDLGLGDWLLDIDEMTSADLLRTCEGIDREFDGSVERTHQAMRQVDALGQDVISRIAKAWSP